MLGRIPASASIRLKSATKVPAVDHMAAEIDSQRFIDEISPKVPSSPQSHRSKKSKRSSAKKIIKRVPFNPFLASKMLSSQS